MKSPRLRRRGWASVMGISIVIPLCMGGCPQFRNEIVDAFETASRGLIDASVTLYFDQLRTDDAN